MIKAIDSFKRLEALAEKKEMTFYALGKAVGFPSSFFSEWKKGKMMPKMDKLLILANYFGVPVTYFVIGTTEAAGEEGCK